MNDAMQGQSPAPERKESPQGSNTWVRLGIFVGFAVVFIVVALQLIPTGTNEKIERSSELITKIALQAALAGWGLCWAISGKWLTLKITMLIALVLYSGLGLWLWHLIS